MVMSKRVQGFGEPAIMFQNVLPGPDINKDQGILQISLLHMFHPFRKLMMSAQMRTVSLGVRFHAEAHGIFFMGKMQSHFNHKVVMDFSEFLRVLKLVSAGANPRKSDASFC